MTNENQEQEEVNLVEYLNNDTVDDFIEKDIKIILLYMDDSTASRFQEEQLRGLLENYEGKFSLGLLNVLESQTFAIRNNIISFPTTLYFKDGELMSSESGVQSGIENSLMGIL